MTVFYDIQTALQTQLKNMSTPPPYAWPNKNFNPTVGTLYVRVEELSLTTLQETLGATGQDRANGVFSLNVFGPINKGHKATVQMADTLATRFKRGTNLTSNSRTLTVNNVDRKRARQTDGWYQVPIDIFFHSITTAR